MFNRDSAALYIHAFFCFYKTLLYLSFNIVSSRWQTHNKDFYNWWIQFSQIVLCDKNTDTAYGL